MVRRQRPGPQPGGLTPSRRARPSLLNSALGISGGDNFDDVPRDELKDSKHGAYSKGHSEPEMPDLSSKCVHVAIVSNRAADTFNLGTGSL